MTWHMAAVIEGVDVAVPPLLSVGISFRHKLKGAGGILGVLEVGAGEEIHRPAVTAVAMTIAGDTDVTEGSSVERTIMGTVRQSGACLETLDRW